MSKNKKRNNKRNNEKMTAQPPRPKGAARVSADAPR